MPSPPRPRQPPKPITCSTALSQGRLPGRPHSAASRHPGSAQGPPSGCQATGGCVAQPLCMLGLHSRVRPPPGQDGAGKGQVGHIRRLLVPRLERPSSGSSAAEAEVAGAAEHPSPGPGYSCCQTAGCYHILQWECCCFHGSRFILASCHHSMSPSKLGASSLPRGVLPCPHPQAPR